MKFWKVVKLTGYGRACNSLTDFEYEAHVMTGNEKYVNFLTFAKGQLISKCLFGVFKFFQKTNEN